MIGNGIDSAFFNPAASEPHGDLTDCPGPHFVFTGQMDYPPNEQAALWAIDSFWAEYRKDHPTAEFHVVGRNPTNRLKEHARDGVTIWGEVPDVRPFVAAADCVVVPLAIARGVQNKVLEAMAMARPVLLTPEAATGIDASDGVHWMQCAADAAAMAERFDAMQKPPDQAIAIGKAARQFVLDHHDWDAMLAPLDHMVDASASGARHAA